MVAVDLTDQYWVVGSGASTHLVRDASMLYELEDCDDLHSIFLLDKSTLRVTRREKASFGHLSYGNVERMTEDPSNGIQLTD
uniref:Uncharacterized protein n=1 Tax=Hyaloperonospora arabidopsidis (strain Emoy2) TaxID=559515 RepID=M4BZ30_HYAAE